jgi:hypothetical protein
MRLIVPGTGSTLTVVELIPAGSAAPATPPADKAAVDESFGKPLSQLPQDAQQTLLKSLPSSAGGLAVGLEESTPDSLARPIIP